MNFTQHALNKLELYEISPDAVEQGSPIHTFYDEVQNTDIKIVQIKEILFVLIMDPTTQNLITLYRTDQRTIDNRRKAKRWT